MAVNKVVHVRKSNLFQKLTVMCIYWEVEYDDDGKREIIPEDELLNMEEYCEEVFGYYTWKLIGRRTLSEYLDSISKDNGGK